MGNLHSQDLEVLNWGLLPYTQALSRQKALVQERLSGKAPDRLVLAEHPRVVTIGKSGGAGEICISETALRQMGVEVCPTDRGGKTTFHCPGQMVAYPIIELKDRDPRWYVQRVQEVVAAVLREYGLEPLVKKGSPGIWVGGAKIAAIGIAIKNWVAYHGVALNVNNDLKGFYWIVPCGKPGEPVTSMKMELGRRLEPAAVRNLFVQKFREYLGYENSTPGKHPSWLRLRSSRSEVFSQVERMIEDMRLGTVCQSAHCPNMGECFSRGTATFMILGGYCTRRCRFCAVNKGRPEPVDPDEPERVAEAVRKLGLEYAVITSVSRDDLPDRGAGQFERTVASIRRLCPDTKIEILVPDFNGSPKALEAVCASGPDMLNHNIETVKRLYPLVRPQAEFEVSLNVLATAARHGLLVKSGLMVGLGERPEEIKETLEALRRAGCDYLTMGQYLAPSPRHIQVSRYFTPGEFEEWAEVSRAMGFKGVAAGPLVRSSYRADKMFRLSAA